MPWMCATFQSPASTGQQAVPERLQLVVFNIYKRTESKLCYSFTCMSRDVVLMIGV